MAQSSSPITARLRRSVPILICRKCLKRAKHGSNLKRALKASLKQRSREQGTGKPRLVLTSCFGVCPKRAIVAASGATLQRGEMLMIGDIAQVADVAAALMADGDSPSS